MVLYILQCLLHAGIGREAAVHRQADAGDETGRLIVQQEQQCAHKIFFAVAEVSHGGGGKDLFGALGRGAVLVEEQLCVLLAGKEARSDGAGVILCVIAMLVIPQIQYAKSDKEKYFTVGQEDDEY